MALRTVFQAASLFLYVVRLALFIYVALTWIAPRSALCYWLQGFLQPFCAPFRRLARWCIRRWGSPFDLTVLFSLIGLSIADTLLWRLYYLLYSLMF